MSETRNLPDADRLSVLAATILLAYALTRFVDLTITDFGFQLPGFYFEFDLDVSTVVTFLVAALTAFGADWLLRVHPALGNKSTFQHWILPALTAWVIGVPLSQLPLGLPWLAGFVIGGTFLMLVMLAEYIVVDPEDVRHSLAAAGLTAVSFALFLILAIALRSAGERLFLVLPALTLSGGLVCLRTLHLRLQGRWAVAQAVALTLILGQLTAAFHYWPLSPVTFGLALLGPFYALTSLIGSLMEGVAWRQALIEPVLVLVFVWGTALWLR